MSLDCESFWSTIPEKALHPARVPILEAFRWIDTPLSALDQVNLFDGENITMWEAAHHLRVLDSLGVVAPDPDRSRDDAFHVRYRLTDRTSGQGS